MQIKWFGQSSFLLTSQKGTRVLIDPYDRFLGYRMPTMEVDAVAVTHEHRDHNQIRVALGHYSLVNQPKEYTVSDVQIKGVKTFHDKENGAKRGENIVFVIQMDGLTICHCGDLGHLLTEAQLAGIGKVDVLLVPAGGRMVLGGEDAARVVKQLQPAVTVPMHYRTRALGLAGLLFEKVDTFLAAVGQKTAKAKVLEVTPENVRNFEGVITLQYE
ncbi:MBL fold metallo-hydrolase [Gorillibacterium massiliense]|uniref:MBL fold metallo-hydrolase n=1 Tax=Gorillibacterium massiliense TaxID=1280390 RepID=UPI0004B4C24E|nr:MBL fold metallo-hydrolase [Gorillibacterium massiliense]